MRTQQTNEEIRLVYETGDKSNKGENMTSVEPVAASSREYFPEEVAKTPIPALLSSYHIIGEDIQSDMLKLYQRNNDLVGWLYIKGVLSLPVVYRDNKYYLDHDFYQKSSKSGTLFLDERHPLKSETQYLVIHGHDMVDGSMFGLLIHYRNIQYIHEHGIINFNTLYQNEQYVVYAVLLVSEDPKSSQYFPYTGNSVFSSSGEFSAFIDQARKRSIFDIGIDVLPSDAILTLSTCLDDQRVLVLFRRVRLGEDEATLKTILCESKKKTGSRL